MPKHKAKHRFTLRAFNTHRAGHYIALEILKKLSMTNPSLLADEWMPDADWEVVDSGGDIEGDRTQSDDPTKCECGTDWNVERETGDFNQKPNQNDIATLFDTVKEPKLGKCVSPCLAVQKFYGKWWMVWKNKKTGKFKLRCSKRLQWHCEMVTN